MNEEFFKRDYFIYGEHSRQLVALKNDRAEEENKKLFNRNLDIFLLAPIVGFIYRRKAERDKNAELKTTINSTQLIS